MLFTYYCKKSIVELDKRLLLNINKTKIKAQIVAVKDSTSAILNSITYSTAAISVYGVEPV
jgi:hypothetical protein